MATTTETENCDVGFELLPQSPFTALHFHYGMLLGEEDFRTEQSYHRGKGWLHNAWCHGPGVLWGYGVSVDLDRGEVRVRPGLLLDRAGREVHLDVESCVNVAARMPSLLEEAGVPLTDEQSEVVFDAHVTARFHACLGRQVPAIAEPCDGARRDTAYSRVHETVELRLVHGPAPRSEGRYPRLALWFGLRAPESDGEGALVEADAEVVAALEHVESLPHEERAAARARAMRRFAALDSAELGPHVDPDTGAGGLVPAPTDEPVPIANLRGLELRRQGDAWELVGGRAELDERPTLLSTGSLQDWLSGARPAADSADPLERAPRVVPGTVAVEAQAIVFETDGDLAEGTLTPDALSVTEFGAGAWSTPAIANIALDGAPRRVRVEMAAAFTGELVRLIARGTGPTPILGANALPLGGSTHAPPSGTHDGRDFVFIHRS